MTTWHAVLVLARARWMIARNTFWRNSLWRKLVLVIASSWMVLLAVGIFFVSQVIVSSMHSPEFAAALREAAATSPDPGIPLDAALLLQIVPSGVLLLATIILIFSSFGSLLNSLYLTGDIDMLLSKPVPMRAVFVVKFAGGLLPQYGLQLLLLGPALLGYGIGMDYGLLYILVLLLVLVLLPLLPMGLGALLVMAVVRVIPASRARELVGILGGFIALGFYVASQLGPEIAPHIGDVNNIRALQTLQIPLLPTAWAGRALIAAGDHQLLTLLVYGGLFVLLSLFVFASCLVLAERLYYAGWSNMMAQSGPARRQRNQRAAKQPEHIGRRLVFLRWWASIEPQSSAVFFKDWRVFPRDIRNVQQLIFPLALAGIWMFRLITLPREEASNGLLVGLSSVGITFFLCYTFSSAIANPGISREGRAFWLLKLAPISALRILVGKLVLAYLPYPLLGTPLLLLLTILSHSSWQELLTGWGLLLLLGLGNTCLLLAMGASFARFDWTSPQQQTTLLAGCLSSLLSSLYIVITLLVVLGLPALTTLLTEAAGARLLSSLFGWLLALIITALVLLASLWFGARGLERIDL